MTTTQRPETSNVASLAERVRERQVGPCRLFTLRTPVRSVVTWRGSFRSLPNFERDEDLLQHLTVSLLDKGTRRLDRFEIAERLENKGAQIEFSSDGIYVDVSGRALSDDVPDVLALMAEQLREPLFDPEEFAKARARVVASIQRSMENTASQASGALTRLIFPETHPNFTPEPKLRLERLMGVQVDSVRRFHDTHFGPNAFTLVFVGDVDEEQIETAMGRHFEGWQLRDNPAHFAHEGKVGEPRRSVVSIPDKQNVDVRLGHAVPFRRDDPDYIPAYLANYVLGGNFSARLMQIIRDEMGLTYGIHSGLYGISTEYAGHWHVAVTLSQANVERGVDATLAEVRRFVRDGITENELLDKQTTVVGSFTVGLATTSGLASSILKNAERGFDVGYLDRFPAEVEAITLDAANDVVQRHFNPDGLHTALAGMVPDFTRLEIER